MAANKDSVRQFAIALATQAIELDRQHQFKLAEQKYRDAIKQMEAAHKLETDPVKQQQLMTFASSYVKRITELQKQNAEKVMHLSASTPSLNISPVAEEEPQLRRNSSAGIIRSSSSPTLLVGSTKPTGVTPINTDYNPAMKARSISAAPSSRGINWALGNCVIREGWMLKLRGNNIVSEREQPSGLTSVLKQIDKLHMLDKLKNFAKKQWGRRYFRLVMGAERGMESKWCAARLEWYKVKGGLCDTFRNCAGMQVALHPCAEFGLSICCPGEPVVYVDAGSAKQRAAWLESLNAMARRFATTTPTPTNAHTPSTPTHDLLGDSAPVSPANASDVNFGGFGASQEFSPQEDVLTALPASKPTMRRITLTRQISWTMGDLPQLRMTLYRLPLDVSLLAHPPLAINRRTFATSNYTALLQDAREPEDFAEFLSAAKLLLHAHGCHNNIEQKEVSVFFKALEVEARAKLETESNGSGDEDYGVAAEYMWTSLKRLRGQEFCTILNQSIRCDRAEEMMHAVMIIRGISRRCESDADSFPEACEVYRGGGFNNDNKGFFLQGTRYRVPGFLATATTRFNTGYFLDRIPAGQPRAFWLIQLDKRGKKDPKYRCPHAMGVHKTHAKGESEYLFAPFSIFTVLSTKWSSNPAEAHVITLKAALTEVDEDKDLPLAPWY